MCCDKFDLDLDSASATVAAVQHKLTTGFVQKKEKTLSFLHICLYES